MTFTTMLKEEISKNDFNVVEARYELLAFLNCIAKIKKDELLITVENASIARRIYKEIKEIYDVNPKITIRMQKRFKVKQIYILCIHEKVSFIKDSLILGTKIDLETLVTDEEKIAFIEGAFLAVGNVSNPSTSGYHLEFIFTKERLAKQVLNLLNYFKLNSKSVVPSTENGLLFAIIAYSSCCCPARSCIMFVSFFILSYVLYNSLSIFILFKFVLFSVK